MVWPAFTLYCVDGFVVVAADVVYFTDDDDMCIRLLVWTFVRGFVGVLDQRMHALIKAPAAAGKESPEGRCTTQSLTNLATGSA